MRLIYKHVITAVLLAISLSAFSQCSSENYVLKTMRVSDSLSMSSVQYYDGLGRMKEDVALEVTSQDNNLVRRYEYDGLGRVAKVWQPVVSTSDYVSDVSSSALSQYDDARAYMEMSYDGSPLDRISTEQGAGEAWSNHALRSERFANSASFPYNCKCYRVSMQGKLQNKGYYPAGSLYVIKKTDEDGHESYEFKNLSGNVVLRRVMLTNSEAADTYYVYDIRGNLTFVLPPNYQYEPDLDMYSYQYQYDSRGNCVWKKLPGAAPVSMVYDRSCKQIFLQDGNLRKQGLWRFMMPDRMGRTAVVGLTDSVCDISDTHAYAVYTGDGNMAGYELPGLSVSVHSLLVVNYYDDYSFLSDVDSGSRLQLELDASEILEKVFPSNSTPNARGYKTGKRVFLTDGSAKSLVYSFYYGRQGRMVQSHSSNILGGWEHVNISYTYAGAPLERKHVHTADGKHPLTESYVYDYDRAGRLTSVRYSVDDCAERVLSSMTYDEYGRMATRNLLGKEEVGYSYNLRSWPSAVESDNLKMHFTYNSRNGNLHAVHPCYGGNLSAVSWQVGNGQPRAFFFAYDNRNMLVDSSYGEGEQFDDASDHYFEKLSYDKMGSIQSLQRGGLRDDGEYGLIDALDYAYSGNKLVKVNDAVKGPYYVGAYHFRNGADEDVEYTYDANGNLTSDANKGIADIRYDVNGLPREIAYSDGRNAKYVYDAEGNKLSVCYNLTSMVSALPQMPVMLSDNVVSANTISGWKTINYSGNVVYDEGKTYILNDIGYACRDKAGSISFHYWLKDHLGNVRVVMNENGKVEQVNDYYPSGALMGSSSGGGVQRYKYNGKELDRLNGLDWYDYGARNYDAALGMWRNPDDFQEEYPEFSEYIYCYNNPMRISDPDGRDGRDRIWGYVVGTVSNLVPFCGGLRDAYQPKDREDYNNTLCLVDDFANTFGKGLNKIGEWSAEAGTMAVIAGQTSLACTGGLSFAVSTSIDGGGIALIATGAATSAAGCLMMANSSGNKANGYNRGKKNNVSSGNKNSSHANQKRKCVNQDKYKQLKAEYDRLNELPNKTPEIKAERNRIERQMKRALERGNFKGENHSRNSKGNR